MINKMKKSFYTMVPNDHIFIENGEAWIIDRYDNELYRWLPSSEFCEYIVSLPKNDSSTYRGNPTCIKYSDRVVCLPDVGECIWIYNLSKKEFEKIEIDNPNSVRLGIHGYWENNGVLWACSGGLKCLMEIDLQNNRIDNYYKIATEKNEKFASEIIKVDNCIYFFATESGKIYVFDIISKNIERYEVQGIEKGINTICFDGNLFWFSGLTECIYTWNLETKELNCYTGFPQDFKVIRNGQKPLFYRSVCLDEYICFIPWNLPETICNSILFVNRKSYQMKSIKIYDKDHERPGAYAVEYCIEGRYLGIYYDFNNHISEIDTKNFDIKNRGMFIGFDSYSIHLQQEAKKGVLLEKKNVDLEAFLNL